MSRNTALAPEPLDRNSRSTREIDIVMRYVEQRDTALARAEIAEKNVRSLLDLSVIAQNKIETFEDDIAYWKRLLGESTRALCASEDENTALRRASELAASHRAALEQLVHDYKSLVNLDVDDIVECHAEMADDEFTEEWHSERARLNHRATELLTREE